jgi:hypothetical protein
VSNALGAVTAISSATETIGAVSKPMNTLAPSITGTLQSGHVLSANAGSWLGVTSISYTYQWQKCNVYGAACENITGATSSSYALGTENVGSTIRVRVHASEEDGAVYETSSATQPIAASTAPVVEVPPTVSGTGLVGDKATATTGAWTGEEPVSYSYQWERCDEYGESCSTISGATAGTYTLTESDASHTVRALVTATDAGAGSTKAASFPISGSAATLVNVSPAGPKTAAYLWGEAQRASESKEVGCHNQCTVVAGEFETDEHHPYVEHYEKAIIANEREHHFPTKAKPHVWGIHDYTDLEDVKGVKDGTKEVLGNYVNKDAHGFVKQTKKLYRSAHIWLTEQGVLLQKGAKETRLFNNPILQRLAAQDFLRLGQPSEHTEWVYYCLYNVKEPHAFDSALLPGAGVTEEDEHQAENPRQAYCVLALDDKEGCPAGSTTKAAVPDTITESAGTVSADVDPQGQPTTYVIEYGTTAEYGHTTTVATVANENGKQSETVALSGLEPCTTYHYQAEAENAANEGTPGLGGDETFTTGGCPPTVTTGSAYQLAPEECSAEGTNFKLTGTIDPNELATTYYFEYSDYQIAGPDSGIIAEGDTPTESAGDGKEPIEVSATVHFPDPPFFCADLSFRLVGTNATGTSYGEFGGGLFSY